MMEQAVNISENIELFVKNEFGDAVLGVDYFRGDMTISIKAESLFDLCEALMSDDDLAVNFLADITTVDWLGHDKAQSGRFEVVYNLCSIKHKYRFFISVHLPEENPTIRSLVDLWEGANWMEREVFDLFGIVFDGHPDLTKILTPDELEGHPLRKDFPLTYEVPQFSWNKDDPPEVIK